MEYIYFVYRDIDENSLSLTDFIGKVGHGTGNRTATYGTYYGNFSVKIWPCSRSVEYERKILLKLCEFDLIRRHKSGRFSEILHISVNKNMTIAESIEKYHQICDKIISIIDKIMSHTF